LGAVAVAVPSTLGRCCGGGDDDERSTGGGEAKPGCGECDGGLACGSVLRRGCSCSPLRTTAVLVGAAAALLSALKAPCAVDCIVATAPTRALIRALASAAQPAWRCERAKRFE
jgi:hypothetical protein